MSSHSSNTNPSSKSLRILVVDDDITCLTIVAAILKKWKYEVVTIKHPIDALYILRINNGGFDLVIIDVHMPQMNGFELQRLINEEFKLPIVLMSADDKEAVMVKGIEGGAEFFIVKPIAPDDLRDLWQYAAINKKIGPRKSLITPAKGSGEDIIYGTSEKDDRKKVSKKKSSRKDAAGDKSEDIIVLSTVKSKKGRIVWTNALHDKFLQAIRSIGLEKAVPKKILEIMDVPALTRENVASHLQKYRIFLHRISDASLRMQFAWEESTGEKTLESSLSSGKMPSNSEIYEAHPPVLDTSIQLGNVSFPILEASSCKSTSLSGNSVKMSEHLKQATLESITTNLSPNSANNVATKLGFCNSENYTTIIGSSSNSSLMQNVFNPVNVDYVGYKISNELNPTGLGQMGFDSVGSDGSNLNKEPMIGADRDTIIAPTSLGNGGGEDDYIFDSLMNMNSPLFDTFFSQQPYAHGDDDFGSIFMNQSAKFQSLDQVEDGEKYSEFRSSFGSNHIGNDVAVDKRLNEQQHSVKEVMPSGFYNGNNQYSNGYFPVVNQNYSQRDEEDFLDSVFGPGPYEDIINIEGQL